MNLRVVLLACGLLVALTGAAQSHDAPRASRTPGHLLFTDGTVRRFKIQTDEAALAALQKDNRSYVRATVREGTNVFHDVGIHLKGMGSFRPIHEKPSFAVKFDKFSPGQRYEGLTKVMLNNSMQDGTFLAELIATGMFRDAGQPAARVTHAFVELNGRDLGLYVLIEGMNREFLRQHFKSARGNLYEAYLQDIDQRLDQDGGDDTSQADLKRLAEIARLPHPIERWHRLHQVLDVDAFLSFTALELFSAHTDGYAANKNNYRLYHDPSTDRFAFITHGMDWAFGNPGFSIRPLPTSILVKAVVQTPEGRRQYRERMGELFTNVFRLEVLTNRVHEAARRLAAAGYNAQQAENHARDMNNRLAARARSIATQLAQPEAPPLAFSTNGIARLKAWASKSHAGDALFDRPKDGEVPTLHIVAGTNQASVASWRTNVLLGEGRYLFEGRARTTGLVPKPPEKEADPTKFKGTGAGLRISGENRTQQLIGDSEWTALAHEFEVQIGGNDVELVCELRALKGEVWFDATSLRLVRKPVVAK